MASSCRPSGIRQLGPGGAVVGRPPHVVQGSGCTGTAHQDDAAVQERNAGMVISCRPPGTRIHLSPRGAAVGRPPHVVQIVGAVIPAREDDAAIRERDAGVIVPCRPPGTRVHPRPRCATVCRPPHIVQRGTILAAHEHDAPVREHNAGVIVPCRPPGARVHLRPRGAIGRPPHIIPFSGGKIPTAHKDDAAVRQRDAGMPGPFQPPGARGLLRPGLIIRLVAEEPRPPGRIAGRLIGEGDVQGRQASSRRAGERRCRRQDRDRDIPDLGESIGSHHVAGRQADGVGPGARVGVDRVLVGGGCSVAERPGPRCR